MTDFRRRSSFSGSGSGFGPGSGFPPGTEAAFRPGRDYNEMYPEVSGPPGYPPPSNSGVGRSFQSMPNAQHSSSMSQSYQSGGLGYASSGGMPSSYPTREHNSFTHDSPDMEQTGMPPATAAFPSSYDGSPLSDNLVPPLLDDGFGRGRSLSIGGGGGGYGPPALLPSAPPMTPHPSQYSGNRMFRSSSVGPMGHGGFGMDPHYRPGGRINLKFRLKGAQHSGVSIAEIYHGARISQGSGYLLHDIAPDMYRQKITLKIRVRLFFLFSYPPVPSIVCCVYLTDITCCCTISGLATVRIHMIYH
jgi:hypothetical protein